MKRKELHRQRLLGSLGQQIRLECHLTLVFYCFVMMYAGSSESYQFPLRQNFSLIAIFFKFWMENVFLGQEKTELLK